MMNQPPVEKQKKDWRKEACIVMYVTFKNNPRPSTFYSRDMYQQKFAGNIQYWLEHFDRLINFKWEGKVKEYVIYVLENGQRSGDPIVKMTF